MSKWPERTFPLTGHMVSWQVCSSKTASPLATAEELKRLIAESRLIIAKDIKDINDVAKWPHLIQEFIKGLS